MHPQTAAEHRLKDSVTVSQGEIEITLPLVLDEGIALDAVYVANAWPECSDLGEAYGSIDIKVR